jgi:hypothetical protein
MFFNIHKGRSVGSLMDKSLNQNGLSAAFTKQLSAVSNIRYKFQVNGYEAQIIEQMKDRLLHLYSLKKGRQ